MKTIAALISTSLLFIATASAASVTLAWDAVDGATGYAVYQAEKPEGPWVRVSNTTQTVFTVSGTAAPYFCVTTLLGLAESEPSFVVSTFIPW